MQGSEKSKEDDLSISGLGPMVVKDEGHPISYDDPVKGYAKTYTHVTYALGFRVSQEVMEDERYNIIKKMPKALSRSAYQTREVVAASVWNNGFTVNGPDGKPFFSASHPLAAGGTGSNTLDTPADLAVASLTALIDIAESTVDDKNMLLNIKVKKLIVPSGLKWTARELLKSDAKVSTNYSSGVVNSLKDEDLSYFSWPWLTDSDAWFLQAAPDDHEANYFWRKKFHDEQDHDFDTGDLKFKGRFRSSCGFSDWRGNYGSEGAA